MTGPGFLIYRCRRCGLVLRGAHAPNIADAVISITLGQQPKCGGVPVHLVDSHLCRSELHTGLGVTDLIGAEPDAPEADGGA